MGYHDEAFAVREKQLSLLAGKHLFPKPETGKIRIVSRDKKNPDDMRDHVQATPPAANDQFKFDMVWRTYESARASPA